MIIRKLRPDEKIKSESLMGLAFDYPVNRAAMKDARLTSEVVGAFADDGETLMAQIYPEKYEFSFCGEYLPAIGIAGVSTAAEHRRMGAIGKIFKSIFDDCSEAAAFLYPSSYMYYEKFGFSRVLDIKGIDYPVSLITEPLWHNAALYDGESKLSELLDIHARYAKTRNLEFKRTTGWKHYNSDPLSGGERTYIIYNEESVPSGYVTLRTEGKKMHIHELIYTDIASLRHILGFLRLFEGQIEMIEFFGVSTDTPLEYLLKEKIRQKTLVYSSVMGRVLNAEKVLLSNRYPEHSGCFTISLTDKLINKNNAVFNVSFGEGKGSVAKINGGSADLEMNISDFSAVVLSGAGFTINSIEALSSFRMNNEKGVHDFLASFPKRSASMHDHF